MAKLFIFSGNHKQIRKLPQTIAGTLFILAFLYILLVNAQSALSTGIVLLKNSLSPDFGPATSTAVHSKKTESDIYGYNMLSGNPSALLLSSCCCPITLTTV
ncbi:MAG: hypothetical protein Q8909_10865 [Bacteroidota bacterium]|nr:hypothetical protein [Bacteroidota bacterium]